MLTHVFKKGNKSEKTSDNLNDLHINDCNLKGGGWGWWKSEIQSCTNFVYLLPYQLQKKSVLALFDLSNKINTVYPTFAKELGLLIRPTDIRAQKINSIMPDTYGM